ncbi:transcriptional regulator [Gracilibacillus oryzae]|uniref:Transcriptional regulator n=1 Tax=Gracilibacillus oryzae TaxID=1672701 RepID=A0A7C8GR70_9BACI|nr:transcriptional regulator [Gracilibacillus oryzae]KAB8126922.1 transcriptional regulator [Gracilibacillus oryzae]
MNKTLNIKKTTFKHIEAEWYNYHWTLKEIAQLREEIMNPPVEIEEDINIVKGANSVRQPGDPTSRLAMNIVASKQLQHMDSIVRSIESVYNALPDDYKKLVRIRYWRRDRRLTWDGIAGELNVSKRQAMRWRDEIIQATIELLGWR